jgi:hypothetical protein
VLTKPANKVILYGVFAGSANPLRVLYISVALGRRG